MKLAGQNCPHTRLQKNVEIAYKSKVHITRSDTTTITRDSVVCCARQGLHKPSTQNPCKACMLPCKTLAGALSSRTQRGCVYALHSVKCGFYFDSFHVFTGPIQHARTFCGQQQQLVPGGTQTLYSSSSKISSSLRYLPTYPLSRFHLPRRATYWYVTGMAWVNPNIKANSHGTSLTRDQVEECADIGKQSLLTSVNSHSDHTQFTLHVI